MTPLTVVAKTPFMNVIPTVTARAGFAEFNDTDHWTRVAGFALQINMGTVQIKAGLLVVVEFPERPGGGRMARTAVGAEPVLMNIRVSMTIDALLRRIVEAQGLVAILAHGIGVGTDERKIGEPVIEQDLLCPATLVMALTAVYAELGFVGIVLAVAGITIGLQADLMDRRRVTVGAARLGVAAQQGETGVDVMLEQGFGPARGGMAVFANRAIQATMFIVRLVAGNTLGFELIRKLIRNMTVGACDIAVCPG